MGFLDDLTKAAKQLGSGLADIPGDVGNAVVAPAGFVLDIAMAPFDDDESFVDSVKSSAAYRGHQLASGVTGQPSNLGDAVMGLLHGGNAAWEHGIERGLTTGAMLASPEGIAEGRFLGGWREAWNASEHVGVGEALWDQWIGGTARAAEEAGLSGEAVIGAIPIAGGWIGMNTSEENRAIYDPEFDLYDDAQRERAFSNGINKAGAVLTEFGARWYMDPLYLTGKAAFAYRRARVVKPIHAEDDVDRALSGAGPDRFRSKLDDLKTPEERHDWLMRNKAVQATMRHGGAAGPALVHELALARTASEREAILRLAASPTAQHNRQLYRANAALDTAVWNLRDSRIPLLDRMIADADSPVGFAHLANALRTERARAARELKVLEAQFQTSTRQLALAGSLRSAPRITAGQRLSDATGFAVFQASRYNLPMRVYKSALTKRGQIIDLNRPSAAADNARRAMDRIGHGFGGGLRGHGLSAAEKGALQLRITGATNVNEAAAGVRAVEDAMAAHYAARIDVSPENFKLLVDATRNRRDKVLGGFSHDTAYSGARNAQGGWLDEVRVGEDGVMERWAMSHTDMANKLPMIDVDALARAAVRHKDAINGMTPKQFQAYLDGYKPSKALRFRDGGEELLTWMNRVWKPAQLMRLGWPIRVLVDEQLRIMSQFGALAVIPMWGESARESFLATRGAIGGAKLIDAIPTPFKAARLHQAVIEENARRIAALPRPSPPPANWLPDSVVRNDEGQLLTVYHGTNRSFTGFDDAQRGSKTDAGWYGEGHYFTVSPDYASQYTQGAARAGEDLAPNVRMAHLDLQKVWNWEKDVLSAAQVKSIAQGMGVPERTLTHEFDHAAQQWVPRTSPMTLEDVRRSVEVRRSGPTEESGWTWAVSQKTFNDAFMPILKGKGYQGVKVSAPRGGGSGDYVVFDAKNIKSPHGHAQAEMAYDDAVAQWAMATKGMTPEEVARLQREGGFAHRLEQRREDPTKGKFKGTRTATDATGKVQTYDDVFAGEFGDVMKRLVSSDPNFRALITGTDTAALPDAILAHLRQGSGRPMSIEPKYTGVNATSIDEHAKAYAAGWEKAANEQMGMDPIFRKILEGWDDAKVVSWLRNSKEGRALRRENPIRGSQPVEWVATLRQHVDHYLPSQPLRDLALEGRAKISHLNSHFPDGDMRPTIHGESIANDRGNSEVISFLNWVVEAQYKYLGAAPTNVLSRHPYAALIYRKEMDRQIGQWAPDAGPGVRVVGDRIPDGELEAMRARAREYTIGEVRQTLYELTNSSNLAHAFRFLTPFYQAWQEVLTTWGRLALEDPSRLARLNTLWEAPSRLDVTYTDPATGTEYVALPNVLQPMFPDSPAELGMPKDWVRQLMLNNEFWFMPGVGPTVQVPLGEVLRRKPTMAEELDFLMPYGVGDSMVKDFLPTALKRASSRVQAENDRSFQTNLVRITQDLVVARNLAENDYDDAELAAEAVKRAKSLTTVTGIYALTLPFSPKYRSPYQLYIDAAKAMRLTYEGQDGVGGYPDGKDENGLGWKEAYYKRYGEDFFVYTESLSKTNTGLPPSELGHAAMEKYGDLIAKLPKAGALLAGPEVYEGTYSSAVSDYQMNTRVGPGSNLRQREQLSPEQMIEETQKDLGWDKWRRQNQRLKVALYARGLESMSQPGARDLADMKRAMVETLADQYPAWAKDYRQFELGGPKELIGFLNDHADDPRLDDRPGWGSVRSYLKVRKQISGALKMRRHGGGSANLQAEANADLKHMWDARVDALTKQDLDFEEIHFRWLNHDLLTDGG